MIAHVGGVPLEEMLPSLAGAGRRPAGRARLDDAAPATPTGAGEVSAKTSLGMKRTYAAPAERVFDAFTTEEVMRRWWHGEHDWETTEAEVDLRVGGGSGW